MNVFILGAIAACALVCGLFFLRFWQGTKDRLFLLFAIAFWLEAVSRTALAFSDRPNEGESLLYLLRFFAYVLIIVAVIDKNLSRRS